MYLIKKYKPSIKLNLCKILKPFSYLLWAVKELSIVIHLQRALYSKNNHDCHIEGSLHTEVLKTGYFKRPFEMKDFSGYKWWTLFAPIIKLCDGSPSFFGSAR